MGDTNNSHSKLVGVGLVMEMGLAMGELHWPVISVDDHVVEPPHLFEGRMPAHLSDRAPYVKTTSKGNEIWVFDGQAFPQVGLNAVVGRSKDDSPMEPVRFDQMRPGCFDPKERVADMDEAGIWASVSFPSQITGFCGAVYAGCSDAELGQACVRAWNDWLFEEWVSAYPGRFVPLGVVFLADVDAAVAEVERNAARGFTAVTLPEQPHRLGLPSLHSGHWDPLLRTCAETGTVVCLHVGSSGMMDLALDGPLVEVAATLFSSLSLNACADWLWSGVALRFPDLKIAMSEGGLGWVPLLADRLDYIHDWSGHGRKAWPSSELTPTEVLLRNFWFCSLDDPSIWPIRDRIGVDHITVEVDYPHADSTWPDTQAFLAQRLAGLSAAEQRAVTHENAAALFRHPLPPDGWLATLASAADRSGAGSSAAAPSVATPPSDGSSAAGPTTASRSPADPPANR